jgi:hypothetical protein
LVFQEHDALFTPGKGKLTRLLLYVLDPSKHARPANIPESQWQFALRKARASDGSATSLWPVAIQGMGQLKIHRDEQQKGAEANRRYLSELEAAVRRVAAAEEHEMRRRAQCLLRTHAELAHRLLKVRRSWARPLLAGRGLRAAVLLGSARCDCDKLSAEPDKLLVWR